MSLSKSRILYILKYLWENTDDNHPATANDIVKYLETEGVAVSSRTVPQDIERLQEFGFDIIKDRKVQYQYFIGSRNFELPELKLLVDAVESSRFISAKKSSELVGKLCSLTSVHQEKELNRHLVVDGRVKTENKLLYLTIDTIHKAINESRKIRFQYLEYTAAKKLVHKHNGYRYSLSPYALLWYNDNYYVLGYSDRHQKIAKFRVDRIDKAELLTENAVRKPADFRADSYLKNIFSMYDGEMQSVCLHCDTDMMKVIVDRFGKNTCTTPCEDGFTAEVKVSVSPTFFGWLFGFDGKIRILSPKSVCEDYKKALKKAFDKNEG